MAAGTLPIEFSPGKSALPAAIPLGQRQQRGQFRRNALEGRGTGRLPHRVERRIAAEHLFERAAQRLRVGEPGRQRREHQPLELYEIA